MSLLLKIFLLSLYLLIIIIFLFITYKPPKNPNKNLGIDGHSSINENVFTTSVGTEHQTSTTHSADHTSPLVISPTHSDGDTSPSLVSIRGYDIPTTSMYEGKSLNISLTDATNISKHVEELKTQSTRNKEIVGDLITSTLTYILEKTDENPLFNFFNRYMNYIIGLSVDLLKEEEANYIHYSIGVQLDGQSIMEKLPNAVFVQTDLAINLQKSRLLQGYRWFLQSNEKFNNTIETLFNRIKGNLSAFEKFLNTIQEQLTSFEKYLQDLENRRRDINSGAIPLLEKLKKEFYKKIFEVYLNNLNEENGRIFLNITSELINEIVEQHKTMAEKIFEESGNL